MKASSVRNGHTCLICELLRRGVMVSASYSFPSTKSSIIYIDSRHPNHLTLQGPSKEDASPIFISKHIETQDPEDPCQRLDSSVSASYSSFSVGVTITFAFLHPWENSDSNTRSIGTDIAADSGRLPVTIRDFMVPCPSVGAVYRYKAGSRRFRSSDSETQDRSSRLREAEVQRC